MDASKASKNVSKTESKARLKNMGESNLCQYEKPCLVGESEAAWLVGESGVAWLVGESEASLQKIEHGWWVQVTQGENRSWCNSAHSNVQM